jgi:hypothetical protein
MVLITGLKAQVYPRNVTHSMRQQSGNTEINFKFNIYWFYYYKHKVFLIVSICLNGKAGYET